MAAKIIVRTTTKVIDTIVLSKKKKIDKLFEKKILKMIEKLKKTKNSNIKNRSDEREQKIFSPSF